MMKSKLDAALTFLNEHLSLWRCPICHAPFQMVTDHSLVCPNNHWFDVNKKGTLNFLNHQVKTEYQREMFLHRRHLLQAGFFTPFLRELATYLQPHTNVIDVGCGEGTPTQLLAQMVPGNYIGFDIAKDGINLATQQTTNCFFCVADLTNLPFNDGAIDTVVDIFSPSAYHEFDRVLAPGGQLLKIIPNSGYLHELRQALFSGEEKGSYDNHDILQRFMQTYPQATQQVIQYQFALDAVTFSDLIAMTPLTWRASDAQLAHLQAQPLTQISVDVTLLVAKKC